MNTKFYFPILALALSVAACNDKKAATQTGGIDVANLDRSVTPNQDFYQFACGGWMQAHPLTDEYGRFGSFDLLAENNRKQMQGLIEELAAKKSEPGSVARKIGDLYNMAMDTVKLNGDGSTPIQPVLEKIKAVKTPKEMVTLVAEMTRQGFGPYFGIYIGPDDMNSSMNLVQTYQGGLGLGDRDYYLKEDEHSKEIRTKYQEHIVKMFELAGWEEKEARQAAADVMAIETRLAEAAYEKVKMRDPHASQKLKEEDRIISVLSDGLGSGIKASVLSAMTATMAMNYTAMNESILQTALSIIHTLPKDMVRKISYSTFCIFDIDCFGNTRIVEYESPAVYLFRR